MSNGSERTPEGQLGISLRPTLMLLGRGKMSRTSTSWLGLILQPKRDGSPAVDTYVLLNRLRLKEKLNPFKARRKSS